MSVPARSSRADPPRIGDVVCACSDNGRWFNIKIEDVARNGSVIAHVIPSDLERYRKRSGKTHNGRWHKRISYRFDQNDIEFHKR